MGEIGSSMNIEKMTRRQLIGLAAVATAAAVTDWDDASRTVGRVEAATMKHGGSGGGKAEQVAPGVWRIRFGKPEKLTPLSFRTAPIHKEGFSSLTPCDQPPFSLDDITFRTTGRGCAVTLPMTTEERIFGFGLNTKLFDKTDRRVFLRPSDDPEGSLGDSHAPVPFYVSTEGYGVYMDTARYASFYSGNVAPTAVRGATGAGGGPADNTQDLYRQRTLSAKTMLVDVPSAEGVDVYIFGGPAMGDAVCRYNLFSGGGAPPPLWGLGVAYRGKGDFSAADSLKLAQTLRDEKMPCDIWGVEPGWQTKTYSCSFVWNTGKFPNPDGFIREMRGLGYRTSFWEHAFTHSSSPIHKDLEPFSGDYRVWDGLVPDFAGKSARTIFGRYQDKVLYAKGADSVKLDECDNQPDSATPWSFPEASSFPSGLDGEQYHSLIGALYQQTMWEPLRRRNKRTWGLVRNAHALAAPLPYVVYSDSYDHRCYVRGLVNAGFSGLLWTPEVRDAGSPEELCRRIGTVIFSPYAMVNAWYIALPPWIQVNRDKNNAGEPMPEQASTTDAVRSLFQLRMSLLPYLYSAFHSYAETGTPPTRALVMDWPDDKASHAVDDQFLCGPSLMVAPMFTGQTNRDVYLPPGLWYDYWTGEKLAGGRKIEGVSKPLDQVPLYVRDNTLLPLAEPIEHVTSDTRFALIVRVYGDTPTPVTLYADDGETYDYEHGALNRVTLSWNGGKGEIVTKGGYTGPERYEVVRWTPMG
ncbi:MAG: glycoside hydrolase, family 31 [Capsulimonas sp.]|nr:glycoside hydrolase, family 31 [Capsulimonas sp.]